MKKQKRARRKHSDEYKLDAVRAYHGRGDRQLKELAEQFDVDTGVLRRWVREVGDDWTAAPAPAAPAQPEPVSRAIEPDESFLGSGLAERMKTLVGVKAEPPPETEPPPARKKPGPKPKRPQEQALLPWTGGEAPRQVTATYVSGAPETPPTESDPRMLEYLKRTSERAMQERNALAIVLGMIMHDPDALGGSFRR